MVRLHFITGKGGVGKTVVATAMALTQASLGKRVLLAEIHGRNRVSNLLQVKPVGYNMREVFNNLYVIDINRHDAIHEYAVMILRFEALYRTVFENRFTRRFINLVPSLGELVTLGKIWYHLQEQQHLRLRFDCIVVDAPASGHAIALFGAPPAIADTIPSGPMRDNADKLWRMLTDTQQTAVHVVTTPEEMPITEGCEIIDAAKRLGMKIGKVMINQYVPPLNDNVFAAMQPLAKRPNMQALLEALQRQQQNCLHGQQELQRLPASLLQQAIYIPQLPLEKLDPTALRHLGLKLGDVG